MLDEADKYDLHNIEPEPDDFELEPSYDVLKQALT
jgi:hypothetical protein